MIKIALISDNHSYIGEDIIEAVEDCDEIWHAGDIGERKSVDPFIKDKKFIAVYGNIDTPEVQAEFPLFQAFDCGGVKVLMTHIGGYPGRYNKNIYHKLMVEQPDLFISGHSHILKVMRDHNHHLLHMNPGAYGYTGFHHIRTILKFDIENSKILNVRVVELGPRNNKQ